MAERVDMVAPADLVGDLRHHDLVDDGVVGEIDQRPHHDDEEGRAGEQPAMLAEHRLRRLRGQQVDEPADHQIHRRLDAGKTEAGQHDQRHPALHALDVVPHEGEDAARRRAGLVEGLEDVDAAFEEPEQWGEHGTALLGPACW